MSAVTTGLAVPTALAVPVAPRGGVLWRRFRRSPSAMAGAAIVLAVVLAVLLAPEISPFPRAGGAFVDFRARHVPPGALHWLGTDDVGRDLLSRILFGYRTSAAAGARRARALGAGRRAARPARRLFPRRGGSGGDGRHRHRAGDPAAAAGARGHQHPLAEPAQHDDRARGAVVDLAHAADLQHHAPVVRRGLHRRLPRDRRRRAAHPVPRAAAELRLRDPRQGLARRRVRDPGRRLAELSSASACARRRPISAP